MSLSDIDVQDLCGYHLLVKPRDS